MSNLVIGFRRANEQDVRGVNDMPAPVLRDGVLTIVPDDRQYVLNNDVFSEFPLAFPGDGKRFTWNTINRAKWIYTGTDACFRDLDAAGISQARAIRRWAIYRFHPRADSHRHHVCSHHLYRYHE